MRLLLLTVDWAPIEGGIATLSEGLARALARRGHEVTVLAPARPGAGPGCERDGVRVERWPGYDLGPLRWLPFALRAARRIGGYDLVLAMNPAYGGLVAWAARALGGPPYLAWAYGFELLKAHGTPLAPLYRRMFGAARATIAISGYTASLLARLGVSAARIRIIHPGVDLPAADHGDGVSVRRRLGLGDGPLVLTVGRLVERKGHRTLLAAFAEAAARRTDLHWVVAGRGPLEPELSAEARRLGLEHRIHLLGYVGAEALEELWQAATLFALLPADLPGDAEGFGIVYLEAGAHGVPVLAAASGGVVDAVRHEVTGLLVAPDDPDAAAAAMLRLLDDPGLAARLGTAGREAARALVWDRVAERVEELLR